MRGRILTLATITLILISTQGTVANPGGEGDGNRDFVCGGSCHGDPTLKCPFHGNDIDNIWKYRIHRNCLPIRYND